MKSVEVSLFKKKTCYKISRKKIHGKNKTKQNLQLSPDSVTVNILVNFFKQKH